MDHGRVLSLDAPAALKRSLGGEVEMHVGVRGDADGFAQELGERLGALAAGSPSAAEQGVRVRLRESSGRAVAAAVATAAERGVAITDLAVAEPTLETVFLNLTGRELRE
jgi:ABC-2 type transport system ATP-binding protein